MVTGLIRTHVMGLLSLINKILAKFFKIVVCISMYGIKRKGRSFVHNHDYFRHSSLELVASEINEKNIQGCVAELGVYKGVKAAVRKFSQDFNAPYFPMSDYCGSVVFMK
ncbi:MAG: hypothetical protein Ta2B_16670 [Termitinemataceae bacterium]|nr:MAG: hypothetical protein Ta2B_16670 [Termitinemataceae bacterium]